MQAHTPAYSGHVPSQRPYYALRRSARRCVSSLAPILTSSQIDGPPLGPSPPRGFCCLPVSQPPAQVAPLPCPACAVSLQQPARPTKPSKSRPGRKSSPLSPSHRGHCNHSVCLCAPTNTLLLWSTAAYTIMGRRRNFSFDLPKLVRPASQPARSL
jgi:hypothetical protein